MTTRRKRVLRGINLEEYKKYTPKFIPIDLSKLLDDMRDRNSIFKLLIQRGNDVGKKRILTKLKENIRGNQMLRGFSKIEYVEDNILKDIKARRLERKNKLKL